MQDRFIDVGREHQRQLLQPLDDLVDVFHDARDRLMLVHHAVQPERPDGGAPQRGQQHAAQGIAEGMSVAALERLQAELGGVGVVLPLRHFDDVGAHQPGQIESRDHLL